MSYETLRPRPAYLAAILLAATLSSTSCDPGSTVANQFMADEQFSFTYDVVDQLHLDLVAINGNIRITAGVDATTVTHPIHTATATKVLALQRMSEEAAGYVVLQDFAVPATERRLLSLVEADTRDAASVRAQLVDLHRRILTLELEAEAPDVEATWALWDAVERRTGDPREAWRVVLTALLQDPRMVLY